MTEQISDNNSIGIVEKKTVSISLPDGGLDLKKGGVLHEISVAYETYGTLSPEKDNAIFICHALTGDSHVAGRYHKTDKKPGWWDDMVGPGKGIDTNYYYVICANILGGCSGTTGPSSNNPATGKPYGSSFPIITVEDIIHVHKMLLDDLEIKHLAGIIGGSFGGMQVLEWSILYPNMIDNCICMAAGACLSSQALAFDLVASDAILSDPNWSNGDYYESGKIPSWGLAHARKIGHITYLSKEIMEKKFGREKSDNKDEINREYRYQVENYLNHQGSKLVERFDANSYIRITNAMDSFDLAEEFGSLEKAFENITAEFLVVGLSSDWLFPPEQSIEIATALIKAQKQVSSCVLETPHGHDTFLIDIEYLSDVVRSFLPWIGTYTPIVKSKKPNYYTMGNMPAQEVFNIIEDSIRPNSRILDLGCGNGELLGLLKDKKQTSGFGVDIDIDNIIQVMDRGCNVFHGDLDDGLSIIPDKSYDYAILSSTLQVVRRPKTVLREMLRVANEGIVTFPNFGNLQNLMDLGFKGRMPKSQVLPHEWYESPNIHLATLKDFLDMCRSEDVTVLGTVCIPGNSLTEKMLVKLGMQNLGAARVLVRITKK